MTDQITKQNASSEGLARPANSAVDLGAIKVTGADAREFLQGQLTQDLAAVAANQPLLAGWASAKGRLLSIMQVLAWDEAIYLVMPEALCASVVSRLQMFVLRADVSLELSTLSIALNADTKPDNLHKEKDLNYCFVDNNILYFRCQGGPQLALYNPELAELAPTTETRDWRSDCITAGIPTIFPGTQERFVPQMVNLDLLNGISFTKGCYVGQEIVARTQNLGRIKRRMYGFSCSKAVAVDPGDSIYLAGKEAGQIVDSVVNDELTQLLAVVRIDQCDELFSLDLAQQYPLIRIELPYQVPTELDA